MTRISRIPSDSLLCKLLIFVKKTTFKIIKTKNTTILVTYVWKGVGIRGFYNFLSVLLGAIFFIIKERWQGPLMTTFILAVSAGMGGNNFGHILTNVYLSYLWNKTLHRGVKLKDSNPRFIKWDLQGEISAKGLNRWIGRVKQAKPFFHYLHFPLFSSFSYNFIRVFHPLWIRGEIGFPFTYISLSCKRDILQFLRVFPDWKVRKGDRLILCNPQGYTNFAEIRWPIRITDFPSDEAQ